MTIDEQADEVWKQASGARLDAAVRDLVAQRPGAALWCRMYLGERRSKEALRWLVLLQSVVLLVAGVKLLLAGH